MKEDDIKQDQKDECKQKPHAIRHLRADRASRGGKYQGRHGEKEGCRQGGDLTNICHVDVNSLLVRPRKIRSILLNLVHFRNDKCHQFMVPAILIIFIRFRNIPMKCFEFSFSE